MNNVKLEERKKEKDEGWFKVILKHLYGSGPQFDKIFKYKKGQKAINKGFEKLENNDVVKVFIRDTDTREKWQLRKIDVLSHISGKTRIRKKVEKINEKSITDGLI